MTAIVSVQDADRNNVGQLDEYVQLDCVLRFNDVSTWSIAMPRTSLADSLATPGARIYIEGLSQLPITGPVNQQEVEWDEKYERLVISGFTDEVHLFDRLVFPSAPTGSSGTIFSDDAYDVRTAVAETAMKNYVKANATADVSAWDANRAVDGLSVAVTESRGTNVTGRGRFQILGELIQQLAVAGGYLGFRVSDLEFDVYEPANMVDEARFDIEVGNLAGFKHSRKAPEATHVLVAGGGQAEARTFQLGGDDVAASVWNRRVEQFRDRRDTTDLDELEQQLFEEIAAKAEVNEVTMRPIDTSDLKFGRDYYLGDLVTVQGIEAVLAQVDITLNGLGQIVKPSVAANSTIAASSLLAAFDAVRALRRRVSGLERNY